MKTYNSSKQLINTLNLQALKAVILFDAHKVLNINERLNKKFLCMAIIAGQN
jgi:capsule polysaccharide export protein KpsE/RkpR